MEQTKTENRWTLKNAIMLAVFAAIIFVLMMAVMILSNLLLTPVGAYYAAGALSAVLCGPFYLVLARRVGKHGVLFFLCALGGLMFGLMGQLYHTVVYLVLGLVGEAIMWPRGSYQRFGKNLVGLFIFMLAYVGGGIFPMLFFRQQYLAWYSAYSDADAVAVMVNVYGSPLGIGITVGLLAVGCVAGAFIGRAIVSRHVQKARI